jgi:paraquat-inducible protein A
MIAPKSPIQIHRCRSCRREFGAAAPHDACLPVCPHCGAAIQPLAARLINNRNAATLAITALLLLIFGLLGPFMDVSKLGNQDRFSLLAGIARLVEDGHFALGAVIFLFSAVFPLAKLSLILAATSSLAPLSQRARHRLHHVAELTAKYSLLDVVVIALLIVILKVDGVAEVKPGWGTFSFLAAALTSMLAGLCVDAKQWEHDP